MSKAAIHCACVGCVLLGLAVAARSEPPPLQALHVLSPRWVVWAHDYNDATDARIYAAERALFDELLVEQEKLEDDGREPNWVRWKNRRAVWARGYAALSDQHLRLAEPTFFAIRAEGDPAYARPRAPSRAVAWVQPLGDRIDDPRGVMRNMRPHQVGHYAFLELPEPMCDGGRYEFRQRDGRVQTLAFSARETRIAGFKINQLGYHPTAPEKYAYLGGWIPSAGGVPYGAFTNFHLRREADGMAVFSGVTRLRAAADWRATTNARAVYSGEDTYELDFSAVTNEGVFHLQIEGLGRSAPFRIDRHVLGEAFFTQARGFYHQRCGTALVEPFTAWTRNACHTNPVFASSLRGNGGDHWLDDAGQRIRDIKGIDFLILRQTGRTNEPGFAIHGGWHDAADYDRRESHHYALWDLLGLYELNAAAFTDGQLRLPESGNGIPDLLDEAVWGLQVWNRAQRADGSVPGRLETIGHPNHPGMPDRETLPWFVSEPTRESTMYYAASAAWLARALKPYDARTAADFQRRAQRAYQWAAHGTTAVDTVTITIQAKRGSAKTDEPVVLTWKQDPAAVHFPGLLAAQELWALTGDARYRDDAWRTHAPHAVRYLKVYPNYLYECWGVFKLARAGADGAPEELVTGARAELLRIADERLAFLYAAPYRHPWNPEKSRRWGGALSATWARYFIYAHALTGDERYRTAARLCADFHLGANPLGYSHTTGLGYSFPPAIQDAETRADEWFEPVPGLTPYGIIIYPYSTLNEVYRMTVPAETKGGPDRVVSFLPPPYDGTQPPIPEWRRIGPSSKLDPLCNEFTMQETLSPAVLMFGYLLDPGWMPDDALKQRRQRERAELRDAWFRLP
ncbi:MAG TPA: glycoside hydrolase family 9 protein [Kiritimatiellia bacterium]|nr:glycoside hydrolase family 9 protein [Kiritimatiellia bacterium]